MFTTVAVTCYYAHTTTTVVALCGFCVYFTLQCHLSGWTGFASSFGLFGQRDRHVEAESGVDRLHHSSCTNIFVHYQKTAECWCEDQHIIKCLDTRWHLCMFVLLHLWTRLVTQWKTSQLREYLSSFLKSILIKLKLNSNTPEYKYIFLYLWAPLSQIMLYPAPTSKGAFIVQYKGVMA